MSVTRIVVERRKSLMNVSPYGNWLTAPCYIRSDVNSLRREAHSKQHQGHAHRHHANMPSLNNGKTSLSALFRSRVRHRSSPPIYCSCIQHNHDLVSLSPDRK